MEERDWLKGVEQMTAEAKADADKKKRLVGDEDFVTKWPLHAPAAVEGFSPPKQISLVCESKCRKETTWSRLHVPIDLGHQSPDKNIQTVSYICNLCEKAHLTVIYRADEIEERVTPGSTANPDFHTPPSRVYVLVKVTKIGQYPPPSVAVSKSLNQNLGSDLTALYRKALVTRNQGYGLAAVSYIRRVVEDKTNELIEVAAEFAEAHAIDPTTVAKMRAAANSEEYVTYEDKLKIASTVFPGRLLVGDINPLQVLYSLVSKGLHGLSESECVVVADATLEVFEHIFTKLKAEVIDSRAFEEKIKKMSQPGKILGPAK
jgi:hypothetical protein